MAKGVEKSAGETNESSFSITDKMKQMADWDLQIGKEQLLKHRGFLFYVFGLLVLFIYNSHLAENNIRKINRLQNEIKDLRSEYVTLFRELMRNSRQSELAKRLEKTGLKELTTPPHKISLHERN